MKYGAMRKFYPIQLSDLGETNSSLDYIKNDARRKFKYSFGKFDRWNFDFLSQFEISVNASSPMSDQHRMSSHNNNPISSYENKKKYIWSERENQVVEDLG